MIGIIVFGLISVGLLFFLAGMQKYYDDKLFSQRDEIILLKGEVKYLKDLLGYDRSKAQD